MKRQLVIASLLVVAFAAAYWLLLAPPEEPSGELLDEHAGHSEDIDDPELMAVDIVSPPVPVAPDFGYLCRGTLEVRIPEYEEVYPEVFTVRFNPELTEGTVQGLWPSYQFRDDLEPSEWTVYVDSTRGIYVIEGYAATEKTSQTSRITIAQAGGGYEIFWSVFPIGFRTPIEHWASSGTCEGFCAVGR